MHQFLDYDGNITSGPGPTTIIWQNGPIINSQFNGASIEGVIRATLQRVKDLDHKVPHPMNKKVMHDLSGCLAYLDERTRDRYRRNTLGTDNP
jgi:ferritin-like protein